MTLIYEVEGDLLEAQENLILHQTNCRGKMGSGVAKQIRDKWSEVYDEYRNLVGQYSNPASLLGISQIVLVNPIDNQYVVNLFSQLNYGYDGQRYTDYEALYVALEETARFARTHNLSVALPKFMGCDRGGASWDIVYAMIEEVFKNHTQPIVIYKLKGENSFFDKSLPKKNILIGLKTPVITDDMSQFALV